MTTKNISQLKGEKWIIGMVHLDALPGTPKNKLTIELIARKAIEEAKILERAGIDAIMIENMHDVPYLKKHVGPEIVACMTAVATGIRKFIQIPVGIQILAAANREALAVALAAQLDFIRVEGFVFAHLADEGYLESCAGELLRYRKMIGAEHILIFTDIQKKHSSHAITSDLSLKDQIETADYFLSDGVIITGTSTGKEALVEDVKTAWQTTKLPVLIGSGITLDNIQSYWNFADAFIVGSWFKNEGDWKNKIAKDRVVQFMKKVQELRNGNC
ncbi:MAG: BtpA/SgcQ family protein [Prolixibacteraceae bacterium]